MKKMVLSLFAAVTLSGGITCFGDVIDVYITNSTQLTAQVTVQNACNNGRDVGQVFNGTIQKGQHIVTGANEGCVIRVEGSMVDGKAHVAITPFAYTVPMFTNSVSLAIQKNGTSYVVVKK